MRPWHITWSTEGRLPIFPDEARRLLAIKKIAAAARHELTMFCIVDDHIHVVLYGDRPTIARRARAITRILRRLAAVPIDTPRIRPINGRAHMTSVFGYILRQPEHHGLPGHPALWSGSCLLDLVGARRVEGGELHLNAVMPRATAGDAMEALGLPRWRLEPAGLPRVAAAGAHELVRVSAAALGVTLPLGGREADIVHAKRVACRLARDSGLSLAQLALAGGFSERSARRLAAQPVPDLILRAVLLRLALEDRVRDHAGRARKS